jgi:hypothetical protein
VTHVPEALVRTLRRRRLAAVAFTLLLSLAACVSGGAGGAGGAPRGPSDRLTPEELDQWASQDLFNIVQRLRPAWMQVRAPATAQGRPTVAVVLDGQRLQGSLELLRNFKGGDLAEVRFLDARDATTRYGTDMAAGAILIVTKS